FRVLLGPVPFAESPGEEGKPCQGVHCNWIRGVESPADALLCDEEVEAPLDAEAQLRGDFLLEGQPLISRGSLSRGSPIGSERGGKAGKPDEAAGNASIPAPACPRGWCHPSRLCGHSRPPQKFLFLNWDTLN